MKKKRRTSSFFDCSGCFIILNCPVKTGRCSDESVSVPPAGFPSVSSSNFLNLLNYWCPAVSIIFCSFTYPLNVPPCSPSLRLPVRHWSRGVACSTCSASSSAANQLVSLARGSCVHLLCVCPVSSWVTVFFIHIFSSPLSACLHLRLLALLLSGSSR